MEKKFKCKDEVIFQNSLHFGEEKLIWNYGIVNYEDDEYVYLVGGLYINKKFFKVIPYEGNEHLVGTTTDDPEEEIKLEKGEWVMVFLYIKSLPFGCCLRKFESTKEEQIVAQDVSLLSVWPYCIKFADFNPSDMEETSRHILCVKNGKIVRYHGKD